jgi:hypothetical protein
LNARRRRVGFVLGILVMGRLQQSAVPAKELHLAKDRFGKEVNFLAATTALHL